MVRHSVGEFAALAIAGHLAFPMVYDGRSEDRLCQVSEGGTAAVIGLDNKAISSILSDNNLKGIDLANFNSPGQIVI